MTLIPVLYCHHVFNSFFLGDRSNIRVAEFEILSTVNFIGRNCTTGYIRKELCRMHIHKRYLTINNAIVKLVELGYINNHVRITGRGKTRYTYTISLLGQSILSDFEDHCKRFMEDYNAGKYPR